MKTRKKTLIIPCSGVGKVHGLLSREAALELADRDPAGFGAVCLALLVAGDAEALDRTRSMPCVTVDGCPKLCAHKNVEMAGGAVVRSVKVMDAMKKHRGLNAGTATALTEDGWALAAEIAADVAADLQATMRRENGKE